MWERTFHDVCRCLYSFKPKFQSWWPLVYQFITIIVGNRESCWKNEWTQKDLQDCMTIQSSCSKKTDEGQAGRQADHNHDDRRHQWSGMKTDRLWPYESGLSSKWYIHYILYAKHVRWWISRSVSPLGLFQLAYFLFGDITKDPRKQKRLFSLKTHYYLLVWRRRWLRLYTPWHPLYL